MKIKFTKEVEREFPAGILAVFGELTLPIC